MFLVMQILSLLCLVSHTYAIRAIFVSSLLYLNFLFCAHMQTYRTVYLIMNNRMRMEGGKKIYKSSSFILYISTSQKEKNISITCTEICTRDDYCHHWKSTCENLSIYVHNSSYGNELRCELHCSMRNQFSTSSSQFIYIQI